MKRRKKKNSFVQIYTIIRKIPKGKVTTYGTVAKMINRQKASLGITPRIVGFALHANKDSKIPCHRVVNKRGRIAANYSMGGLREQKRRLLEEGIIFKDEMRVDL